MPELYGNPFKWELRAEIRQLKADLSEMWSRAHDYWRQKTRLELRLGDEILKREQVERELTELKKRLLELAGADPSAQSRDAA